MIKELIKELTLALMLHQDLMVESQKMELQGIKRFNRYESIEMLHRINALKNHAVEFNYQLMDMPINYAKKSISNYHEILKMIVDSRTSIHNLIMANKDSAKEIKLYDIVCDIAKDIEKEFEVFSRITREISMYNDDDMKLKVLKEFDADMHEYMKKKEN